MLKIPVRFNLAILIFLGTLVNYMLRVNINIAILEMTRNATDLCKKAPVETKKSVINDEDQEIFCWSEWEQGLVKTAFYYGYPLLQFVGGNMAEKYGTRYVFGVQNVIAAMLAILTPGAASLHLWVLIALRFLQGLAEGVTYPALPPLINKWVPVGERARFVSFTYMGGAFGPVVAFPLCGFILDNVGWEAVFYLTGSLTLIWSFAWFFYVTDNPDKNTRISEGERRHILENRGDRGGAETKPDPKAGTPYKAILTNPVIWVIMFCDFTNIWGILIMINEGPKFIDNVLHRDIASNGLLSALPHLWTVVAGQIFGITSDFILKRQILSKAKQRRLMHTFGFLVPAIGTGLLGYITDDWKISVLVMTLCYGFRGATYFGHTQAPLDLAPTFSGSVYGLCNGFGALSGLVTPLVATALTASDPGSVTGWRYLFLSATGLYATSWLLYMVFAKVDILPFDPKSKENK